MRRDVVSELIRGFRALLMLGLFAAAAQAEEIVGPPPPELLTNLFQLRNEAERESPIIYPFRIVANVVDVDSVNGAMVLRDGSGVEFIRGDFRNHAVEPGATVCLTGEGHVLRRQSFGLSIIAGPVVDNDGIHPLAVVSGKAFLHAGRCPIKVEWFNRPGDFSLDVEYEGPGIPRQGIPSSMLSRAVIDGATRHTNFSAGLDFRCCEGAWDVLPDFGKCQPVKTGVATNFDIGVRTRDENVGLDFKGFITIPRDGVYTFYVGSDDGSRLFVGEASMDVQVSGKRPAPAALKEIPSSFPEREIRPWVTLEGTVNFTGIWTNGGELQIRVGNDDILVDVFQGGDLISNILPHSKVQITGIYEDVMTEAGARVPGRLLVLNWKAVRPVVSPETSSVDATRDGELTTLSTTGGVHAAGAVLAISTGAEIKALSTELARQELPVSIRGVVTAFISKDYGAVVQDSTRGVFVDLHNLPETEPLRRGEFCQIDGVTGPGLFAPVIVARRVTHLGSGQLPKPLRATWDQLVNGSLDTEYAEIEGVVTAVRDQRIALLTRGGKIALDLIDFRPEALLGYKGALLRIRGCVFANFNMETHKLGAGSLLVRGAAIDVVQPAPREFSDAPQKSIGELLFYDPKLGPFRFLRVSGQIIYGRPGEYILTDGTNGVHVTTRNSDSFSVGDLVDTVGFLELGGPAVELKEAIMHRTGSAPLPAPTKLAPDQLLQANFADTLVKVDATLMNQWREGSEHLLELQSGFLAFKARINSDGQAIDLPPAGSRLELTGAYSPQGNRTDDGTVSGFELLLHSPTDIRVLATPPWWNLKRLLALAGILALLLCVVLIWNKELRRQVQERTRKWETEIRNRQRAELRQAAETERSRIARDLHDELGTGLTEVSLLASAGLGQFQDGQKIRDRFNVIAEKARALVSGLDVIVWAIDPKRNSLQSFTDYLAVYANELFSQSSIECRLRIRMECGEVTLTEAARHSLFLAVKESLNNVIRHASAMEVDLRISQIGDRLHIVIADNGRGFDRNTIRRGNGLTNLQERLRAMQGECHIESQPGRGTTVKFIVPLAPEGQISSQT